MVTWLYLIVIILIVRIIWIPLDNVYAEDISVGEEDVRCRWSWYNGCKYGRYGQHEMTSQVDEQMIGRPEKQNEGSN